MSCWDVYAASADAIDQYGLEASYEGRLKDEETKSDHYHYGVAVKMGTIVLELDCSVLRDVPSKMRRWVEAAPR